MTAEQQIVDEEEDEFQYEEVPIDEDFGKHTYKKIKK